MFDKDSDITTINADFMGQCVVNLSALIDRQEKDVWLVLKDENGNDKMKGKPMGRIQLRLRWRFNPDTVRFPQKVGSE